MCHHPVWIRSCLPFIPRLTLFAHTRTLMQTNKSCRPNPYLHCWNTRCMSRLRISLVACYDCCVFTLHSSGLSLLHGKFRDNSYLIFSLDIPLCARITESFITPSMHNTQDNKIYIYNNNRFRPSSTRPSSGFTYRIRSIRRARSCPFTVHLKSYHILLLTSFITWWNELKVREGRGAHVKTLAKSNKAHTD